MKQFIIKVITFSALLLVTLVSFYFSNKNFIAAYKVTNSYSFNEKIKWLPAIEKKKILSIGSSMTLTNISSNEVIKGFNTKQYLNLSSWGLTMNNIQSLIPFYTKLYKPEIIIIASNIMDFKEASIQYDVEKIDRELNDKSSISLLQLTEKYYRIHTLENRQNLQSNNIYTSLRFDDFGGVSYAENDFQTIESRWNLVPKFNNIVSSSYADINKVSNYLKQNNILLIFIQTPIRYKLSNPTYQKNMKQHTDKINAILKADKHLFINFSNKQYPDSFYSDSTHFNSNGANAITKEAVKIYLNFDRINH